MKRLSIIAVLAAVFAGGSQFALAQQQSSEMQSSEGQFVEVAGARIFYQTKGDGTPLVLVHGYPLSGELFREQRDGLSDEFQVVTLDLRGFGRSETPNSEASLETYAGDVLAVMDALEIDQAIIGGHSMGGMTVMQMYKQAPERFLGMLLIDTAAMAAPIPNAALWSGFADQAQKKGVSSMSALLLPQMLTGATRLNNKQLVNEMQAMVADASVEAAVAGGNALAKRPSYESLLSQIDVPTLIIVGVEDTVTPIELAQKMHDTIPNSQLTMLDGAAHASSIENPEQFNEAVLAWFREASIADASNP